MSQSLYPSTLYPYIPPTIREAPLPAAAPEPEPDTSAPTPQKLKTSRQARTAFGGLSLPGSESPADLPAMSNLSPRAYPAMATRLPRERLLAARGSGTPHGMAALGGYLYFVEGSTLYRSALSLEGAATPTVVGSVSDSDKQLAALGGRLYIFPDKLYLDAASPYLRPMELSTAAISGVELRGNTVTLPAGESWAALGFLVGDALEIINEDDAEPMPEGSYTVTELRGHVATVSGSFATTYRGAASFRRSAPMLDRVTVSGNRLLGIRGNRVHISAVGTGLNWTPARPASDTDAATLESDSPGSFSAIAPWQGYAVAFKPDRVCKLLGDRPGNFTLSESVAPGVPYEMADTLCPVGGSLYYHAAQGLYRYAGSTPERVGLVDKVGALAGIAGTDGVGYHLALKSGGLWQNYLYMPGGSLGDIPRGGVVYREDNLQPAAIITLDGFLCIQASTGVIWLAASDGRTAGLGAIESAQLAAMAELRFIAGAPPEKERPIALAIRATATTAASTLKVRYRASDGESAVDPPNTAGWGSIPTAATFSGQMRERLLRLPLHTGYADGLTVRLEMTGYWVIHGVYLLSEQEDA